MKILLLFLRPGEATKAHQAVKEMPVSREAGWVVLGEAQMGLGHYRASVLAYRSFSPLLQAHKSALNTALHQTKLDRDLCETDAMCLSHVVH